MKKCINRVCLSLLLLCCAGIVEAASVDTLAIYSPKMGRDIRTLVVVPDVAKAKVKRGAEATALPVLYLLHGYSGREVSWMALRDLRPAADEYGMLIVCPNGENSWYWDSPTRDSSQFESFISRELPSYVDSHYPTIADRSGRAIAGLSMGGHGAMWNAIRNKDVFGAAGSMSGGLDLRPFPEKWMMKDQLGDMASNQDRWDEYTVINALGELQNKELSIIVDCGVDDFFIDVNRNFHEALVEKGITHDYIERAGAHTAQYWRNSIVYQMFYFHQFFQSGK
ncbi:MAG: alpha/beta hydrolase family protein [Rikenellaceae bacterium]